MSHTLARLVQAGYASLLSVSMLAASHRLGAQSLPDSNLRSDNSVSALTVRDSPHVISDYIMSAERKVRPWSKSLIPKSWVVYSRSKRSIYNAEVNEIRGWCQRELDTETDNTTVGRIRTNFLMPADGYESLLKNKRKFLGALDAPKVIVEHTMEGSMCGSMGKMLLNANAHFAVTLNGVIYQLLPLSVSSDGLGASVWNGDHNIARSAINIENEGMSAKGLTAAQEESNAWLIDELQAMYALGDTAVIGHYQAAVQHLQLGQFGISRASVQTKGRQTRRIVRPPLVLSRGRRTDGSRMDWVALGVEHTERDPDVIAGTVLADARLTQYLLARYSTDLPFGEFSNANLEVNNCKDIIRVIENYNSYTGISSVVPVYNSARLPFAHNVHNLYSGKLQKYC